MTPLSAPLLRALPAAHDGLQAFGESHPPPTAIHFDLRGMVNRVVRLLRSGGRLEVRYMREAEFFGSDVSVSGNHRCGGCLDHLCESRISAAVSRADLRSWKIAGRRIKLAASRAGLAHIRWALNETV